MVFCFAGNEGGIHANALALRRGMDTDVDRRMGGVGQACTLIEAEGGIVVAQKQGGEAASLEFLAQAAAEGEGDILFCDLVGEGCAAFVASVTGLDHGKIMPNAGRRYA